MTLLTRDEILAVDDLLSEDVPVPEWGGTVRVRGLTGLERDKFESAHVKYRGRKTDVNMVNIRARLVSLTVVDGDGKRMFTNEDVRALGQKSAVALQRVFDVAQRLSGMSAEDLEELTKNSEDGQSEGFTFS
jgi:hypothetical protein